MMMLLLSLVAVACLVTVHGESGAIGGRIEPKLLTWPCSRVISQNGPQGCGSSEKEGSEGGVLYLVQNVTMLSELLAIANSDKRSELPEALAIVLDDALLTEETMTTLIAVNDKIRIDNVIVTIQNSISQAKEPYKNPEPVSTFNANGDGLRTTIIPFSMTRLRETGESAIIIAMAEENERRGYKFEEFPWLHASRFDFYLGKETMTTETCMRLGQCDPLGGLSIWGTVGRFLSSELETVVLTSDLDSNALFHDLAYGRNKGASSIVASLLAAHALRNVKNETLLTSLSKQIVVALFQGETWSRIGSRRFVRDVASGEGCKATESKSKHNTCADPVIFSLAWTQLNFSSITDVIASDQLILDSDTYFVHGTSDLPLLQGLTADLNISVAAAAGTTKPPSPSDSFEESDKFSGNGVVLSGYDTDFGEVNRFYRSRYDRSYNSTAEDQVADRLNEVATLLARMALVSAGATSQEAIDNIEPVESQHARDLWRCFSVDFSCPLVANVLQFSEKDLEKIMEVSPKAAASRNKDGPFSLFAGVYQPFKAENDASTLLEEFVRNYLAIYGRSSNMDEPEENRGSCSTDFDCLDKSIPNAPCAYGKSSYACIKKQCICSNAYFHDALAPEFSIVKNEDGDNEYRVNVNTADPLYTEPRWQQPALVIFIKSESQLSSAVLLILGLLASVATWISLTSIKRRLNGTKYKLE